jgi:hypothetical protein
LFDRNPFEGFDFRQRRTGIPRILIIQAIALGVLLFLWWLLPPNLLVCLLVPAIATLVWVASFGWQQALARLIEFLQSLENRPFGGSNER